MKKWKKLVAVGSVVGMCLASLSGCGSKPKVKPQQPPVSNTSSSTSAAVVTFPWDSYCAKFSKMKGLIACRCDLAQSLEELNIAKEESIADARSELARILNLRVTTMIKRYRSRTIADEKHAIGSTFEAVAKQVAKEYLKGSKVIDSKTFKTSEGSYMVCSAVALEPETIKNMISEIAKKANLTNPRDEDILYEEFKAYKAQQELEEETK
ncbi:MAG: hypothetical protein GXO57_04125 [Thermodesulfobacteria bacterium]|nr:hypothetical protein [Thermodesulfobacteriota bacterium]